MPEKRWLGCGYNRFRQINNSGNAILRSMQPLAAFSNVSIINVHSDASHAYALTTDGTIITNDAGGYKTVSLPDVCFVSMEIGMYYNVGLSGTLQSSAWFLT